MRLRLKNRLRGPRWGLSKGLNLVRTAEVMREVSDLVVVEESAPGVRGGCCVFGSTGTIWTSV